MNAIGLLCVTLVVSAVQGATPTSMPAGGFRNGIPSDPNFFPIAVWLQAPANAPKYKAIGMNIYMGLWQGPTEAQLAELKKHGMMLICELNEVALKHLDDPMIIAWMHGDEPDNAQPVTTYWKSPEAIEHAWPGAPKRTLAKWSTAGSPPIPPKTIVVDYERIRKADPSRPVLLNLGQGVAFDKYIGRGYRTGKLEDYPQYMQGCDIVSFDIYPVVHDSKEVAGNLWYVAKGVERLVGWSQGKKRVWDCIECTHIGEPPAIASPEQIRAEVWMSLIHGSTGLIYFVHEFKPKFIEAGLLAHEPQMKAVAEINKQILALAPVLNSPTVEKGVTVTSSDPETPVAAMLKSYDGATYVFAVAMRDKAVKATFKLAGAAGAQAEVLDENRTISVKAGVFEDSFKPYEVHLYRVR